MARQEKIIIIEDGGEQKKFKVRQMGATSSEWFFLQLMDELAKAGVMQKEIDEVGGVMTLISMLAHRQDMMNKLIECVSRVHEGGIESQLTAENTDGYVDDFKTLFKLRMEAFAINGFFQKGGLNELNNLEKSPAPSITIKRQK
jgi:hypothetical protein